MGKVLRIFWKHKKLSIFLLFILALSLFVFFANQEEKIEIYTVKRQDIAQTIIASGKIDSETTIKLNFLTSGKLVFAGAQKGDFVKKGQTLAALDTRSVQKNLENYLIDYSKQRNSFEAVRENNQNRSVEQALNDSMKRILQNNQYDLDKSVISVELQTLAKEQSYLVSPIDGVVVKADPTVTGSNITASAGYIIADPENLIFQIEVDEVDIGKINIGMPLKIVLESFPDEALDMEINKIDFMSHISTNGGNVFDVEARMPFNTDSKYRIGMTGDAEIILVKKNQAITAPLSSIIDDKYVYIKSGDTFEKREVLPGIPSDTDVEILSGLGQGDEIAVSPDEAEEMLESKKRFIIF